MFLLFSHLLFLLTVMLLGCMLYNLAFKGSKAVKSLPEPVYRYKRTVKKNGGLIQYYYLLVKGKVRKNAVTVLKAFADSLFPSIPGKEILYSSFVPVALIGLLLYAAARKKRAAENVSAGVGVPGNLRFDFPTASLIGTIPVWFDNASPQAFRADQLYLKFMQGSANVGNAAAGGFIVPPGRTQITADFRVGLLALGANLFQMIQYRTINQVQVDGFVTTGPFNIYIREVINIPVPNIPEWVRQLKLTV